MEPLVNGMLGGTNQTAKQHPCTIIVAHQAAAWIIVVIGHGID